jgi:hypothetical protein
VNELKEVGFENAEFFMDTAYFAYDRSKVLRQQNEKKYIIVNVNKNGERFFNEIFKDVQDYIQQ